MRFVLVAALLAGVLASGGVAYADVVEATDTGGVTTRGLSKAQRRALDIDRLVAYGSTDGLIVEVTFKGNVEALVGKGKLARAMLALVLLPKAGMGKMPTVVATIGTGGHGTTLRAATGEVAVVRDGKTVTFAVSGGGLGNVGSLVVKAFARSPIPLGRMPAGAPDIPGLTDEETTRIATVRAADLFKLPPPVEDMSCVGLVKQVFAAKTVRHVLERARALSDDELQRQIDDEIASVQAFEYRIGERIFARCTSYAAGYLHVPYAGWPSHLWAVVPVDPALLTEHEVQVRARLEGGDADGITQDAGDVEQPPSFQFGIDQPGRYTIYLTLIVDGIAVAYEAVEIQVLPPRRAYATARAQSP